MGMYKAQIIYLLKSDGDGGDGEEKKRKTEAEVVGEHQEQLVEERTVNG